MAYKSIFFSIFSKKIPFELTILTDDGIFKKPITLKKTKIHICTKSCKIKMIAKYENQVIYKYIYLNKCLCNNFLINFAVNKISSQTVFKIKLHDNNYGLPIATALLNFKQNDFD